MKSQSDPSVPDRTVYLTPTEMAREAGLNRRQVIGKCMELGVPVFQGRIERDLFLAALREAKQGA